MEAYKIYIILTCLLFVKADEAPELSLLDGKIRGTYSTSHGGRLFSQFIGIPYAKPPIAEMRFEDPEPIKPWSGTWIANLTTECIQITHWPIPKGGVTNGQEDCLYINVYVPGKDINPKKNYDVVVHIHGGGFMFGGARVYAGPNIYMDRNVILVTFNYRVGIHGFLSTGDKYLPGNYGMKDQVLALKWINNNIKYFGGNSDSITITGLSAGGASVHYHYLSPMSKNLFTRGISYSGCALNPWTFQESPLKQTRIIATAVGCNLDSTKELVQCMKSRNGAQINEAMRLLRPWLYNPFSPLGLVVDSDSKNPFLPKHPYQVLNDGEVFDVPWIATATNDEGLYPAAEYAVDEKNFNELDARWLELAPYLMHYSNSIDSNIHNEVSQKIRKYYLKHKPISKENFTPLIQMLSDRLFVTDLELAARMQAKVNKFPVYFYFFNYNGEEVPTMCSWHSGRYEKYGICHGDDLRYTLSDMQGVNVIFSDKDARMKEMLLNMNENYFKASSTVKAEQAISFSVPSKDWIPVSKNVNDLFNYLYIGSPEEVEMRSAKELGHRSFWHSIGFQENANLFEKQQRNEL